MFTTTIKTFDNKDVYNAGAYHNFLKGIRERDAVWAEFYPEALKSHNDTIMLRLKEIGTDSYQVMYVPNYRIYMLKNEIRFGAQYGFAYTDFFNAMKAIYNTKKWFKDENDFKVYRVNMKDQDDLFVMDYTYTDDVDKKRFLQDFISISGTLSSTCKLMFCWNDTLQSKPNKQSVMQRFGDYASVLLKPYTQVPDFIEGEGKTKYHFFHTVIEKAESFKDMECRATVYNFDFEQLVSGFEQFFATFNHHEISGEPNLDGLTRNVFID